MYDLTLNPRVRLQPDRWSFRRTVARRGRKSIYRWRKASFTAMSLLRMGTTRCAGSTDLTVRLYSRSSVSMWMSRNKPASGGQKMKKPPLSSCQYTSQKLKARNPSAEKNRMKNRNGWRRASSMYCRCHSFRAAFSSAVMGRVGTSPKGASSQCQSPIFVPEPFMPTIIT